MKQHRCYGHIEMYVEDIQKLLGECGGGSDVDFQMRLMSGVSIYRTFRPIAPVREGPGRGGSQCCCTENQRCH